MEINRVVTVLAALTCAGSAVAADLPTTKSVPAYAPPALPMWTGFYVGVYGGFGAGDLSNRSVQVTPPPFAGPPPAVTVIDGSASMGGGLAGGTIGYNYQFGNYVAGFEVDGGWGDVRARNNAATTTIAFGAAVPNYASSSIGLDWLGTARVRLGYAMGNFLPYVTGGLAVGGLSSSTATSAFVFGPFMAIGRETGSTTSVGWAAGAGFEYMINPSWSVKAEYMYTQLGSVTSLGARVTVPPFAFLPTTLLQTTSRDFGFHSVRAGVNYHFNWGSAPIIASY